MDAQLLICRRLYREKFVYEDYTNDEHDILAIVKSGLFSYDCKFGIGTVGRNEAFCFKKGVHYNRVVVEPTTIYLFRFKSSEDIFDGNKIRFNDEQRIKSTLDLLDKIYDCPSLDIISYKSNLFNDIILQYVIENKLPEFNHADSNPAIYRAITYIDNSFGSKIDLSEIAQRVGMSYSKFNRLFKQETKITPMDYLNSIRNKRAQQLLIHTNKPIATIAEECGFGDPYYFSNFFKKHNHISPSTYRKTSQRL